MGSSTIDNTSTPDLDSIAWSDFSFPPSTTALVSEPRNSGMTLLRRMVQNTVIRLARPYIQRNFAGSQRLHDVLIDGERRNTFWREARERMGRSSFHPYRMRLNLQSAVDRAAYFLGRWDRLETQLFMRDVICEADVVIDIGANRGMFTLCASYLVGRAGLVVSFEPDPASRKAMEREISINCIRNVSVRPYGASHAEGKVSLGNETVRVVKADDHLRGLSPSLIRIAGSEFATSALQGLSRSINSGHPVIVTEIGAPTADTAALTTMLENYGYKGSYLGSTGTGEATTWQLHGHNPAKSHATIVWIHPKSHVESRRACEIHMAQG